LSKFLTTDASHDPISPPRKTQKPLINTAIILNRSPLITRTPSIFERAYYAYQSRIRRALHNPFPYEFYFKQGSPLEVQFNAEERKRERKAFGYPFGKEEVKVNEKDEPEMETDAFSVVMDEQREGAGEKIMPRRHEADETGDVHKLDRKGQRNLYLLLQQKAPNNHIWRFPQGTLEKGHLLHQVGP
jgi:large subunit ribosomal protein L46